MWVADPVPQRRHAGEGRHGRGRLDPDRRGARHRLRPRRRRRAHALHLHRAARHTADRASSSGRAASRRRRSTSRTPATSNPPPAAARHLRLMTIARRTGRHSADQQAGAGSGAARGGGWPSSAGWARCRRRAAPRPRSRRRPPSSRPTAAAGAGRFAHAPGVHLGLEEAGRALHQRLEFVGEPGRGRRAEPADLAEQAEQLGPAQRQAEHRAHDGLDPVAKPDRRPIERVLEGRGELGRGLIDHRVEQLGLGREVVEDRLLAHAQLGGELVERGGVVALRCRRTRRARTRRGPGLGCSGLASGLGAQGLCSWSLSSPLTKW